MSYLAHILVFLILTYLWGSLAEWWVHAKLMHGPKSKIQAQHTKHHKIYPRGRFTKAKSLEGRHYSLVLCIEHVAVLSLPPALLVLPWFPLWSLILVLFGAGHYFLYNHIHSAQHLNRAVWPWLPKSYVKLCWYVHSLHHNNPTAWFNVSLPGADWLLGTAPKLSWADEERWREVESKMFPARDLKAEQQDKEIIKSLNQCLLPSKYSDVGFVGPAPTGRADKAGDWLAALTVKVFVGDVQICYLGANYPENAVYALSHCSWKDVAMARHMLPKGRIMAAQKVMQFGGGLLGLILGPFWGCWSAAPGRGVAVKAGIKIAKSGQRVLVCPEGWAYMTEGPLHEFQTGAVRIAQGANVPIVPVYIKYGSSAPGFTKNWNFVIQVLFNALDPFQRSTAFIVVGEPYNLPADCDVTEETLKLYDKVSKLEPRM